MFALLSKNNLKYLLCLIVLVAIITCEKKFLEKFFIANTFFLSFLEIFIALLFSCEKRENF